MSKVKCSHPGCDGVHIPNKKTEKILKDSEAGINLETSQSLEDFWKAMGMNPHPDD